MKFKTKVSNIFEMSHLKVMGNIPIMLRSKACNLADLSPKKLVERGEHEQVQPLEQTDRLKNEYAVAYKYKDLSECTISSRKIQKQKSYCTFSWFSGGTDRVGPRV